MRRPPWPLQCPRRRLNRLLRSWLASSFPPLRIGSNCVAFGGQELIFEQAPASLRRDAAVSGRASPPSARGPPQPIDLRPTVHIRSGVTPLAPVHRGPVDRVHCGPMNRVHHPVHDLARRPIHDQQHKSRLAPVNPKPRWLFFFRKAPELLLIKKCPSTSKDPYSLVQVLKPLSFSVSFTQGPNLVLLHQNP
jgi:hypothetical protein